MKKESKNLEYKEKLTKNYLKTVSAFSNYCDGEIVFGVNDDFKVVGIDNPKEMCLNIENQINDSIKPKPDYTLKINDDNTITLFVKKGLYTPYKYEGKAYKRNDTSTITVDEIEEKRLILQGLNLDYEELSCEKDNLSFNYFSEKLKKELKLESFNIDTLKSLNLYSDDKGYNNAAYLLADNNNFPGIEIVVFGNSINEIKRRYLLSNESILKQYYQSLEIFENEYIIEEINGGFRNKKELVPYQAFREAIANAIIHRTWDININTKVEMWQDRIIISSPGGLISNMSVDDYINGRFSYLRNRIIANIFYRLQIVEIFATGIKRINESYTNSVNKPLFNVTENAITITLPVIKSSDLSKNENNILASMKANYSYSRSDLEELTGITKDSIIRSLNLLVEKGLITKVGKARSTYYIKK